MAVDQTRRSQLYGQLAGAVGKEAADTMFDLLPPTGSDLATTAGLAELDARMTAGFASMDQRFAAVDARFAQVDRRFEEIDRRFELVDQRFQEIDRRFELVDQRFQEIDRRLERLEDRVDALTGSIDDLRGEFVRAVNGQTRAMLLGVATSVAGIAGLSWTFASIM